MSSLAELAGEAVDALADAVRLALPAAAGGPRVHVDPALETRVVPPALLLGPPSFTWQVLGSEPSDMTLTAALVVASGERAHSRLLALLPPVVEAIETAQDVVVRRAVPGAFKLSAGELPAYLIDIEMGL